jgi:hypothetical protein
MEILRDLKLEKMAALRVASTHRGGSPTLERDAAEDAKPHDARRHRRESFSFDIQRATSASKVSSFGGEFTRDSGNLRNASAPTAAAMRWKSGGK